MRSPEPLLSREVACLSLAVDAAHRSRRLLGVVGRAVAAHNGLAVVECGGARALARQLSVGIDQDARKARTGTERVEHARKQRRAHTAQIESGERGARVERMVHASHAAQVHHAGGRGQGAAPVEPVVQVHVGEPRRVGGDGHASHALVERCPWRRLDRVVLDVGTQRVGGQDFAIRGTGLGEPDLELAVGEQRGVEPGADVVLGVGRHAVRPSLRTEAPEPGIGTKPSAPPMSLLQP